MANLTKKEKHIVEMYVRYFGRVATEDEIRSFDGVKSLSKITAEIRKDADNSKIGLTPTEFLNDVFQNLFGRDANPKDLKYVKTIENNKNLPIATIIKNGSRDDKAVYNTKKLVAQMVAAEGRSYELDNINQDNYLSIYNPKEGRLLVSTVDDLEAKISNVPDIINGKTYMLTTGVDLEKDFTGSSKNDLFIADNSATATSSVADTLNGGAGNDTIKIYSKAATADALPALKSIENAVIYDNTTATVDTSASTWDSVETVTLVRGSAGLTVGANVKTVNLEDRSVAATTVTLGKDAKTLELGLNKITDNVTLVNAGGGTTPLETVVVNTTLADSSFATLDVAGAKDITINANAKLTLAGATAGTNGLITSSTDAKLTINGTKAVSLGVLDDGINNIDASANTGGLTASIGNQVDTVLVGSKAADVITSSTVAAVAGNKLSVDAGDGVDTLVLAAAIATTENGSRYKNFETVRVSNSQNMDYLTGSTITGVEVNNAALVITNMTAAQAANVKVLVDTTSSTFALKDAKGTTDVLTVTLENTTATTSADLASTTVTGFETMNVISKTGSSGDKSALSFAAAADLTALNISGAKAITVATAGIVKAATIDASAMTYVGTTATDYALTLSGNLVKGSKVIGTAAADSVVTSAAIVGTAGDFVTYELGAGNDVISSTVAGINNTNGANGSIKIDGGAGTDKLTLTDTSLTMVDGNFQYVTGVEELAYTNTGAINITTGGFFNTNFASGVKLDLSSSTGDVVNTIDMTSYNANATVNLTANSAVANAQTINTGSGADTITLSATNSTAANVINSGAGNDTINVTLGATSGSVTVNAGAGQDTINLTLATAQTATIKVSEGHSTLSAYDSIKGLALTATANKITLDFDGTAAKATAVVSDSVSGYTAAELTYSIASTGVLSFAGTKASTLTVDQKAYLASTLVTDVAKNTIVFNHTDAGSATADSYVFNNGATTDSLVKLVGVSVIDLDGAGTAGHIAIA